MYTIQTYHMADSLEEALTLLKKSRRNVILGGGMWLRLGRRSIQTAIDLSRLGLDEIRETEEAFVIGGMVPLRALETHPALGSAFGGVLAKSVSSIVGVQFRNTATVGASVFSRYGFSDVITALLALDTQVELQEGGLLSLEAFLKSPPTRDILVAVHIRKDGRRAAYQTQRASATDFGLLDVCLARLTDGRYALSVGARPGVARRCRSAEMFLQTGDVAAAQEAAAALPYGDNMRASAEYRRALARVLVRRAWEELRETER